MKLEMNRRLQQKKKKLSKAMVLPELLRQRSQASQRFFVRQLGTITSEKDHLLLLFIVRTVIIHISWVGINYIKTSVAVAVEKKGVQ